MSTPSKHATAKSIFKTAVKLRGLLARYQRTATSEDIAKLDETILQTVQADFSDLREGQELYLAESDIGRFPEFRR